MISPKNSKIPKNSPKIAFGSICEFGELFVVLIHGEHVLGHGLALFAFLLPNLVEFPMNLRFLGQDFRPSSKNKQAVQGRPDYPRPRQAGLSAPLFFSLPLVRVD